MRQAGATDNLAEVLGTFKFHTPIRIRFGETDANRHVNQVSYFIYIEQARMDYALVEPSGPRLVATARGNLVYFDHEIGKSTPLTPAIREAIARLEGLSA